MRLYRTRFAAVSILIAAPLHAHAATIYVDQTASGNNDGTSWKDAYMQLQDALTEADGGDEVRVAQGVYKPAPFGGSPDVSFLLPNQVIVQGGYAGLQGPDPDALDTEVYRTILSGDLNGDDGKPESFINYGDNSVHVLRTFELSAGAELRGLTIRAGSAALPKQEGGGVLVSGSLTIADCIIELCQAFESGGGVFCAGQLVVLDTAFRNNRQMRAFGGGGAVHCGPGSSFTNCSFQSNTTGWVANGGAITGHNFSVYSSDFIDNYGGEDGGAIRGSGDITLVDCDFLLNHGNYWGAVILQNANATVSHCRFQGNSAFQGGGLALIASTAVIADCEFKDNQASLGGGLATLSSTVSVIRGRFENNHASSGGSAAGGGLQCSGVTDLVNCVFFANDSNDIAGAVTSDGELTAVNCRFNQNFSVYEASVLRNSGNATLINCTAANNTNSLASNTGALHNTSSGTLTILNTILWDNEVGDQTGESAQIWNDQGAVVAHNSCVSGWSGLLGGSGNFGNDPLFLAPNLLRLTAGSPCRDAGNLSWLPQDELDVDSDDDEGELMPVDLDGLARLVSGVVDLGAFEFQVVGCPADLAPLVSPDGQVDVDDFLAIINGWGQCPQSEPCASDINNDGNVDVDDLLFVINHWGACS